MKWKLIIVAVGTLLLAPSCETFRETFDREGSREAYMQILIDAVLRASSQAAYDSAQQRGSK